MHGRLESAYKCLPRTNILASIAMLVAAWDAAMVLLAVG